MSDTKKSLIVDCSEYSEEALELYLNDPKLIGNRSAVARFLHHREGLETEITLASFRVRLTLEINRLLADREIVADNVRLAKKTQKFQDTNRIERKSFRAQARIENAIEEYGKAISEQNKEFAEELKILNIAPLKESEDAHGVGIFQLTDLHANELVDLPHNKFDFEVLAKRMKLYCQKGLRLFKGANVEKVAIFVTGDLLNSDRRLDELLNQATNRAKASVLAQHLITQFILEVRNAGYPVTIVSVLGNESRMTKEMTFSNIGLSDNYDFLIMANIKEKFDFANIEGVNWGSIDKVEEVVEVDGLNILLAHDLAKVTSQQQKTQSTIGRYSLQGIKLDFIMGGHIHASINQANSARSSSMTGSNSYNEVALNLAGRAQQNLYVVQDNCIESTIADLQNTDKVEFGYSIIDKLKAYNTKSIDKLHVGATVFKVVI